MIRANNTTTSEIFPYEDARRGNTEAVKSWITRGGRSDAPLLPSVAETWTPLMFACAEGNVALVRSILEVGGARVSGRVNTRVLPNPSPLHVAARYGHGAVTSIIVELGADVNARDKIGLTPVHYAAAHGHAKVVQILLDSGADESAEGFGGATALDVADMAGFEDIVSMLRGRALGGSTRAARRTALSSWLKAMGCEELLGRFLTSGYDDLSFMAIHGLTEADLDCIGVSHDKLGLRKKLLAMHGVEDFVPQSLKQSRRKTKSEAGDTPSVRFSTGGGG